MTELLRDAGLVVHARLLCEPTHPEKTRPAYPAGNVDNSRRPEPRPPDRRAVPAPAGPGTQAAARRRPARDHSPGSVGPLGPAPEQGRRRTPDAGKSRDAPFRRRHGRTRTLRAASTDAARLPGLRARAHHPRRGRPPTRRPGSHLALSRPRRPRRNSRSKPLPQLPTRRSVRRHRLRRLRRRPHPRRRTRRQQRRPVPARPAVAHRCGVANESEAALPRPRLNERNRGCWTISARFSASTTATPTGPGGPDRSESGLPRVSTPSCSRAVVRTGSGPRREPSADLRCAP